LKGAPGSSGADMTAAAAAARGRSAKARPLLGGWTSAVALILGMFVEAVGYGMVAPTLPFMARQVGAAEGRIGLLVGLYAAVGLFVAVPLGLLAQRFGRRALILLGLVLLTASSIAFVFAPSYAWLLAARVVQGVGAAGIWVGSLTLGGDLSEDESMGRSLSWLTGAWSLGFIIGPAFGGLGSLRTPFVLYAALCAVSLLVAIAWLPVTGVGGPRATLSGILRVFARRAVLASGVATFALAFFYGAIEAFVPLLMVTGDHGRGRVGLLFSVAGLPSVLLPRFTGALADRHGDKWIMVGGFLFAATLSAAFLPLLGLLPDPLLFLLIGCVEVLVYVPAIALLQRGMPTEERVFATASHSYAFSAGFFLGPLVVGGLFPFGGFAMMFATLALVVLAAGLVVARIRV
jgi:MFS family permease